MNEFRNIIIDSRKNIAIGVNYPDAAVSDKRIKIKCLKYSGEGLPFSNHNQATKLNSLYLLNKYLTKIKQLKEEGKLDHENGRLTRKRKINAITTEVYVIRLSQ